MELVPLLHFFFVFSSSLMLSAVFVGVGDEELFV